MKKRGFTLQEFLIAMIIISIITVLVFPKVMDNMDRKTKVAALQRTYLSLSNAVRMMMMDEHASWLTRTSFYKTGDLTVSDTVGTFLKKNFKIAQDCGTKTTPCFASSYKSLDKTFNIIMPHDEKSYYCVSLVSKASICISQYDENLLPPEVYVDVNGPVRPNVAGRDLFTFHIYGDGYVGERDYASSSCATNKRAFGCFRKLVDSNWVMDY